MCHVVVPESAKKDLKIVHIKKDVPNVKEGEIDGLDCSLADGDVVWVAELGCLCLATASQGAYAEFLSFAMQPVARRMRVS